MKTGATINPTKENKHLTEPYIEVYPDGTVKDFVAIDKIPKEHRSFDAMIIPATGREDQSAILIRKSYWDANLASVV